MTEPLSQKLTSLSEYTEYVIRLLANADRTIDIFSPEMKPAVFSNIELVSAAREFVLQSANCRMRILIRNTEPLTRDDHRFLHLIQRISSRIAVRKLSNHFHDRDDAFVVADETHYVLRRQAARHGTPSMTRVDLRWLVV